MANLLFVLCIKCAFPNATTASYILNIKFCPSGEVFEANLNPGEASSTITTR